MAFLMSLIKNKKLVAAIIASIIVIVGIVSFASFSNEPCDWCGESPTKGFKLNNGGKSYVCADCRKKCAWCDDKADKHYENGLEMMVFVCDDCYEDISD
ncbi:MAG: hypothetical protein IKJ69_02475 [Clostridia bacterium]|nr:hypothetical protein [Clostridia bacterium]